MRHWFKYLSAVLALVLVLTGQSMAMARGAAPVAGQAELCLGHLIQIVMTDSDGEPTLAGFICPDCAISAFDSLSRSDIAVRRADWGVSVFVETSSPAVPVLRLVETVARAPPVTV